jgi:hypothetical protein
LKTFEDIRSELSPAHVQLIESLFSKGMSYSGSIIERGDRLLEIKSEGNEIVFNPSAGKIELFTEFIDRSDPTDVGHHVWMIYSDATGAEIDTIVTAISAITGDN